MLRRKPKGYLGIDHQTVGSDIVSVIKILKLPEQILGVEDATRLASIDPKAWYPIDLLLDLMDKLDRQVGHYALLRMGRTLFNLSHEARVGKVAKSARDVIYGINDMYHHSNRGRMIGGWEVVSFDAGDAVLEKTTPHHCVMEQGILSAALASVGCPGIVTQSTCFREGADHCRYHVSSTFTDARWSGQDGPPSK